MTDDEILLLYAVNDALSGVASSFGLTFRPDEDFDNEDEAHAWAKRLDDAAQAAFRILARRDERLERVRAVRSLVRSGASATTDECVVIDRSLSRNRPTASMKGGVRLASRVAWFLAHGDPGEWHVLHKCNNDRCVNVRHLYLGTHEQNMKDIVTAGMSGRKITAADAAEIKRAIRRGERQQDIADRYGIARNTISQIKHGYTWAHVEVSDG